jgi:hypothetical protein
MRTVKSVPARSGRGGPRPGAVSNDEAKEIYGMWREPKPYMRIVPQPS